MVPYMSQCWSLLLAHWAFSFSYSQISFGEWKSLLWNLCITPILATIATLFMSPWGIMGWLGKEADCYPSNRWIQLILPALRLRSIFDGHWHQTQKCSCFFAHPERTTCMPLLQISLSPIVQSCLFQVADHSAKSWITVYESSTELVWSGIHKF